MSRKLWIIVTTVVTASLVLAGVAAWLFIKGFQRPGVKANGGYSAVFQIITPQMELARKEAAKRDLEARRENAAGDAKSNLDQQIRQLDDQIAYLKMNARYQTELANTIITILKVRIDPLGSYNMEWRPQGADRFEVRVPFSSVKSRAGRAKFESLCDQLQRANPNISIAEFRQILHGFIDASQYKALSKMPARGGKSSEAAARASAYKAAVDGFCRKHAEQEAQIRGAVQAYEAWAAIRQPYDDPDELIRMVTQSGVLEFRIAPYAPGTDPLFSLSEAAEQGYRDELREEGPQAGRNRSEGFAWFPLKNDDGYGSLITEICPKDGRRYILLYNDSDNNTMLNPVGNNNWSVRGSVGSDQYGRPAVNFTLDPRGASKMAALTTKHKTVDGRRGHCMAILLDDEVYSAPVIQATISSSGIIEGTFTTQDVTNLVSVFDAGSLPARIDPRPISIMSIDPG